MPTYRVWVHPKRGSDYYHTFKDLGRATRFAKSHKDAEAPLLAKGRGIKSTEHKIPKAALQKALAKKTTKKKHRQTSPFNFGAFF